MGIVRVIINWLKKYGEKTAPKSTSMPSYAAPYAVGVMGKQAGILGSQQ